MAGSTADELLANALKRRLELLLELEALDSLIKAYEGLHSAARVEDAISVGQPDLLQPRSHPERVAAMINTARRILIAEKRPMRRGELRERVEASGYEVVGKDKNKVFGTNLWRSGQFRMIEGKGYWPTDVELP